MTTIQNIRIQKVSIKNQTLAAMAAIVAAVALPQLFHGIGAITGAGTALGEVFLPMHLPVILVGLLAGPLAGGLAGFMGPMVSFLLSGMPGMAMLPFIMIELTVYGLAAGFLRTVKLPTIAKVLAVQVVGRGVRAVAILTAVQLLGNTKIAVAVIWTSIVTGLIGIVLQLVLIPFVVRWVENHAQ